MIISLILDYSFGGRAADGPLRSLLHWSANHDDSDLGPCGDRISLLSASRVAKLREHGARAGLRAVAASGRGQRRDESVRRTGGGRSTGAARRGGARRRLADGGR